MSSWDRARSIPWSHVSEIDETQDLERQKEALGRLLTAQAHEEAERDSQQLEQQDENNKKPINTNSTSSTSTPSIQFSTSELFKQAAFGGCIGSITGAVFGFMDGMRTAGESPILKSASNAAKGKYLLQGTTRSGALFGSFFAGYHVLKYGFKVAMNDPGQVTQIGLAGAASLGALMTRPALRPSLPYAGMLISMDAFSIFMREMEKE